MLYRLTAHKLESNITDRRVRSKIFHNYR